MYGICANDMVSVDGNTNVLERKLERRRVVLNENKLKINKILAKFLELEFEKEL